MHTKRHGSTYGRKHHLRGERCRQYKHGLGHAITWSFGRRSVLNHPSCGQLLRLGMLRPGHFAQFRYWLSPHTAMPGKKQVLLPTTSTLKRGMGHKQAGMYPGPHSRVLSAESTRQPGCASQATEMCAGHSGEHFRPKVLSGRAMGWRPRQMCWGPGCGVLSTESTLGQGHGVAAKADVPGAGLCSTSDRK